MLQGTGLHLLKNLQAVPAEFTLLLFTFFTASKEKKGPLVGAHLCSSLMLPGEAGGFTVGQNMGFH